MASRTAVPRFGQNFFTPPPLAPLPAAPVAPSPGGSSAGFLPPSGGSGPVAPTFGGGIFDFLRGTLNNFEPVRENARRRGIPNPTRGRLPQIEFDLGVGGPPPPIDLPELRLANAGAASQAALDPSIPQIGTDFFLPQIQQLVEQGFSQPSFDSSGVLGPFVDPGSFDADRGEFGLQLDWRQQFGGVGDGTSPDGIPLLANGRAWFEAPWVDNPAFDEWWARSSGLDPRSAEAIAAKEESV